MGIIEIKSDFTQIKKAVDKMNKGLPQVKDLVKRDFKGRVPAQVNKGIKAEYNIGNRVGKEKPSWHDTGEMSGELKYKTSPIGVENFGMKPRTSQGKAKDPTYISPLKKKIMLNKKYTISYTIKGGTSLDKGNDAFISTSNNLPFIRKGPRLPIKKINTLSKSAMIVNDAKDEIEKRIEETMDKRIANHIKTKMGLE